MLQRKAVLFALSSGLLLASGYKIPEQSLSSTALIAAYVANANGADASYFNPANMVFSANDRELEFALSRITIEPGEYTGTVKNTGPYAIESEAENILMPTFHYAARLNEKVSYGFSLAVPGGLTKRWDEAPAKTFAEEFTLRNIELNPTIGYKLADNLAVGGGLRVIQSSGVVKSSGVTPVAAGVNAVISRDLEGDGTFFGYNLAVTYKPVSGLNLAATYRSNVDLKEKGDAKLTQQTYMGSTPVGQASYDGGAEVTVPLPASLALAASYTFGPTTVEFVYDKTMWSAYEELDFEYDETVSDPVLIAAFDDPIEKDWKDAVAYRLGVTHALNEKTVLMAGYSKDETPVPDKSLSFELPDADTNIYSVGFSTAIGDGMNVGAAYLQSVKEERSVSNATLTDGKFASAKTHFVTLAFRYVF